MPSPSNRRGPPSYWLTRFIFLRLMGGIYLVAFLALAFQLKPLLGADGLLPVPLFLQRVRGALGTGFQAYYAVPSVFWLGCSDSFMSAMAWSGAVLSAAVMLGLTNAAAMTALWIVYASFVHVGQLFYGYGWEMMMIEAGFLSIFLCPLKDWRPFPKKSPPAAVVFWFIRWMTFRVMFGAGMIKLRGDPCWRDLTCLEYHFETQPIPNPLSWYFHQLPRATLRLGALYNYLAELAAPWSALLPRPWPAIGGLVMIAFQAALLLSGNLSWLNWLTIALCVSYFDDEFLARFFAKRESARAPKDRLDMTQITPRTAALYALSALLLVLSIAPAVNLLSPRQAMNASFDPVGLVNTYGAFGSVGKERREIVLEGTDAPAPGEGARWREYAFKCAPGDVGRRPCVISPYQYRVDWQIWFAAMQRLQDNPWLLHFTYKLLRGDAGALSLLANNPFPEGKPTFIRAVLYRYRFTSRGAQTKAWWTRERVGLYMPPLAADNPDLLAYLRAHGWAR